ncbi:hypothetical protein H8S84_07980 [Pontibacter sp. SD6]|uniref:Uncharacterized protein n=1 Tax=Pontibacter cellulosilyticus TaxID=1720253 RepID=A0A923SIF8_9BACT|nr:hypothetical protein [Pontibacter cellulosilyticus]
MEFILYCSLYFPSAAIILPDRLSKSVSEQTRKTLPELSIYQVSHLTIKNQ